MRKIYQITDLEEVRTIFDQFRHVVSHLEFFIPKKPPTPKNIGEVLKGPQRQLYKNLYLLNKKRTEILALFRIPSQSNTSLKEKNPSFHSWPLVLRKVTILMNRNLLHATLQMLVLVLKVFIFINTKVQWHMLTHSE